MSPPRASIFEEPEIDISAFTPKPAPDAAAPKPEKVREVSEAAQFRSREPTAAPLVPVAPLPPKREPRRHRTGRNVQFNVKASQETIDSFYAISDRQGWVLGETMEHALAALERELAAGERSGR
jgi:hypothetical protein